MTGDMNDLQSNPAKFKALTIGQWKIGSLVLGDILLRLDKRVWRSVGFGISLPHLNGKIGSHWNICTVKIHPVKQRRAASVITMEMGKNDAYGEFCQSRQSLTQSIKTDSGVYEYGLFGSDSQKHVHACRIGQLCNMGRERLNCICNHCKFPFFVSASIVAQDGINRNLFPEEGKQF